MRPNELAVVACAMVALSMAPTAACAQVAPADSQALTVWLMTMGPGDAVWERFGHNAIRIRDERTGDDRVYNWGMFSLEQTGFVFQFLRGRMRYWMASEDAALTVEAYRAHNRSVTIQELKLNGAQKLALLAFVQRTELPENRFYDYDYFLDNCSTRVRDALDAALGGVIGTFYRKQQTDLSYRDHARRLLQGDVWSYTGIDIGLGRPTDRPITAWEEMFVPMSLQRLLRQVHMENERGEHFLLVESERVVVESTRPPTPERPEPRVLPYLFAGVLLAGIILTCSLTRAAPIATVLATTWCIAAGFVGTVVLLLWTATAHVAAYQNANLLPFNPVWLILAGLIVARSRRAHPLAIALGAAAFAALCLLFLPNQQDTSRVLALVLPIHAAAALAIARRLRRA